MRFGGARIAMLVPIIMWHAPILSTIKNYFDLLFSYKKLTRLSFLISF